MTGHGDPMEFMLRLEPGEVEPARRALEDAGVDFSPVDVMMCTASAGIPARTNCGHEIPELIESHQRATWSRKGSRPGCAGSTTPGRPNSPDSS